MQFRPLLPADLPAAVSLSTQAGWNQTMVHWSRFLALWPQAAIAGCVDDRVVATGTLAIYPSATGAEVVAWIGMILVDEGMRGRGYGTRLFTAMLDRAEALNVSLLGLDATDLGRPLYERHGFRDQQRIDRWIGLPATGGEGYPAACSTVRPMRASDIAAMRALDRAATGVDRTDMLCHLTGESAVTVLVDDGTGGLGGFGMLQEGRVGRIVGPVVAADADGATRILHGLIRHATSVGPPHALVIDCLRPSPLAAALRPLGFSPARELWRMCRPASHDVLLASGRVFAAAGFELG